MCSLRGFPDSLGLKSKGRVNGPMLLNVRVCSVPPDQPVPECFRSSDVVFAISFSGRPLGLDALRMFWEFRGGGIGPGCCSYFGCWGFYGAKPFS